MPIRQTFNHPDRVVLGVASGDLTLADVVAFWNAIREAGASH